MGNQHVDERLRSLFSDLETQIEPLNGPPITISIKPEPNAKKELDNVPGKKEMETTCPFLKTEWDTTIQYGYPHPANLCYKTPKTQAVSLSDQARVCLSNYYLKCSIFVAVKKDRTPNY
jgi:hypothetical protein